MRLAVWSPLPPSPSGIADYVAEQVPALQRHAEVRVVTEGAAPPPEGWADLDIYQVGNSPAHAFVYRRCLERPGVVVLHDWSLHHLVLRETVERGDEAGYVREMRRSHGATGSFVARQVARALGGDLLPALFPLNDRLLERSLAVVGLSSALAARVRGRAPGLPVFHLPHHFCLPFQPAPSREEARRALGLPRDAQLVTAPGLATAAKGLDMAIEAVSRLAARHPRLLLVVAGGVDPRLPLGEWAERAGLPPDRLLVTGRLELPGFVRHLAAADILLGLRFPSHGEMSGAVVRGLGLGRCTIVTAGTPIAEEFPAGCVVPVDPGPFGLAELHALLDRLLSDDALREAVGRQAARQVADHHDLHSGAAALLGFLGEVRGRRDALLGRLALPPTPGLASYLEEEVRWAARDLGLPALPLDLPALLAPLQEAPVR
jgi:glycosyltransferase involved in cell wall biosynthesis